MVLASFFATSLALAPPALADQPAIEGPAPAPADDDEYHQALERVRTAENMANEDPERGVAKLRDALQILQSFGPELAKDPEGQDARTMAQLTLARSLLAAEDPEGARDVMDEAIRTARGDKLPTSRFGPGLDALYREREGVLRKQGSGTIAVDCKVPCRVYVNERPTDARTEGLVLGEYRVWIEAREGDETPVQTKARIDKPDQVVALEFGVAPVVDDGPKRRDPKPRMLPRWAEIVTVVAGVAVIGVGASLWAIDERCPNLDDPLTEPQCPRTYATKTAGIATVAVGGALLLTGGVLLTVDEVRVGRQRGQQIALTWTLRF
jgi:hypothetical protein